MTNNFAEQSIDLLPFSIDRWILLKEETQVLLTAIRMQIAQIELQQAKIRQDLDLLRLKDQNIGWRFRSFFNALASDPKATEQDLIYYSLLANVHLWLISWEGLNKSLRRLRMLIPGKRIDWLHERRTKWFKTLNAARNHLEHMDERFLHTNVSKLSIHSNLYLTEDMSRIVIFNVKLKLKADNFDRINKVKADLASWYKSLPSTLDNNYP